MPRVNPKISKENNHKQWTKEQEEFVMENYGTMRLENISLQIGKTPVAIYDRAMDVLGLGGAFSQSEKILLTDVGKALRINRAQLYRWIELHDFPAKKTKLTLKGERWMIKPKNLWKWLEENQDKFDTRNFKEYELGGEPSWMKEKRAIDMKKKSSIKRKRSVEEKLIAVRMRDRGMSYDEIAEATGRTKAATKLVIERFKRKQRGYSLKYATPLDRAVNFLRKEMKALNGTIDKGTNRINV